MHNIEVSISCSSGSTSGRIRHLNCQERQSKTLGPLRGQARGGSLGKMEVKTPSQEYKSTQSSGSKRRSWLARLANITYRNHQLTQDIDPSSRHKFLTKELYIFTLSEARHRRWTIVFRTETPQLPATIQKQLSPLRGDTREGLTYSVKWK